jgi:LIVCS family branched-chain amino acid:cation transporter
VGITEESAVRRGTIRAGLIAGGMLLVVYAMLTHIGGISGAAFPGSGTGAAVLTALADGLFGRVGQVLLAAIFVIACFNTCVGLIASVGEYFHELLPQLSYPAIAAFFALVSMLLANIGLANILSLSVPVLNAIYPIAIVLIVVEFLPGRFQRTSVWRLSILFTAIQSIPAALPFGPLSTLMNALPLSSLGFGWLLPALIGIGAGLLT